MTSGESADRRGYSAKAPAFRQLLQRTLDDFVVHDENWLRDSGVQQQLEFEGFQLRWVAEPKICVNMADGWTYAMISHWLFWYRRVRRRHGERKQYLMKRTRSFRSALS